MKGTGLKPHPCREDTATAPAPGNRTLTPPEVLGPRLGTALSSPVAKLRRSAVPARKGRLRRGVEPRPWEPAAHVKASG